MTPIDYTLATFAAVMLVGSAVNVAGIVRRERLLRQMREDVRQAGEARGVGAGKAGGE